MCGFAEVTVDKPLGYLERYKDVQLMLHPVRASHTRAVLFIAKKGQGEDPNCGLGITAGSLGCCNIGLMGRTPS
jgi:hypothetical protein